MAARTAGRAHCRPCHLCLPAPTLRAATDNSGYPLAAAARPPEGRDGTASSATLTNNCSIMKTTRRCGRNRPATASNGRPKVLPHLPGQHSAVPPHPSAQPVGNAEDLADGPPDDLDVLAVRERLVDRTAAERCEHVILGNALGVGLAELSAHPFPEGSQAHAGQATRPRGCLEHGAALAPRLIPTGTQVARRRVLAVN